MESSAAVAALAALAHQTRLAAFRLLVTAGPEGLAAGSVADGLGLAPATLSFHLAHLRQAGLVRVRRDGRSLIYSVDFAAMAAMVAFLTENCCGGADCGLPAARVREEAAP